MATAALLKANSLLYSTKWKNNLRCRQPGGLAIKFDKFTAGKRLEGVKVESFTKSAYSTAVVVCSSSKSNLSEKSVIKRWRIPGPLVLMVQSSLLLAMSAMMTAASRRNAALAHVCVAMPLPPATVSSCNCGKNGAAEGDADNNVVKNEQFLRANLKLLIFLLFVCAFILYEQSKIRVIKLQVAIYVHGLNYERILSKILENADLSDGWGDLLQKTADMLDRRFLGWLAGYSSVKVCESVENAEKYFKQLSIEEQQKFDEEVTSLMNVKKKRPVTEYVDDWRRKYAVVTVLVVAKGRGVPFFPKFIAHKRKDAVEYVMKAVNQLKTISNSAEIQAVNIMWTPQNGRSAMSMEELREHYPFLKSTPNRCKVIM